MRALRSLPFAHDVTVQPIKSKIWMRDSRPAAAFRWACSCGRVGPECAEAAGALRGGNQHAHIQRRKAA